MFETGARIFIRLISQKKFTFAFCLIALVILPIHVEYLPPIMVGWVIFWFVENFSGFKELWNYRQLSAYLFGLFILYFLWYLAGLIYSTDTSNGLLLIFRRLSFILLPLVLFFPGEYIIKKVGLLLKIFSLSTLAYVLVCFGYALFRSISFKDGIFTFSVHPPDPELIYINYFFGTDLSFSQHTSYLSMYVLLSVFIALDSFFNRPLRNLVKFFWLFAGIVLMISLYFFSSRAGIMAALLLLPVYFLIKLRRIRVWWSNLLIAIAGILVLLALLLSNERIRYYFSDTSEGSFGEKVMLDNRIPIWKATTAVVKQNWLYGVGVGDACDKLKKSYLDAGYSGYYYDNLNAHNQFLEILLASGIIGLLLFMVIIATMSYIAIKHRNLIYGLFILMMLIFFMFESDLNRLAGVTFFSLFAFLLLHLENGPLSIKKQKLQPE